MAKSYQKFRKEKLRTELKLKHGRMIDVQPIMADVADDLGKFLVVGRFDDVAVDAEAVTFHQFDFPLRASENDDGNCLCPLFGFQLAQNIEAVHAAQIQIQQNDFRKIAFAPRRKKSGVGNEIQRLISIHDVDDSLGN